MLFDIRLVIERLRGLVVVEGEYYVVTRTDGL